MISTWLTTLVFLLSSLSGCIHARSDTSRPASCDSPDAGNCPMARSPTSIVDLMANLDEIQVWGLCEDPEPVPVEPVMCSPEPQVEDDTTAQLCDVPSTIVDGSL